MLKNCLTTKNHMIKSIKIQTFHSLASSYSKSFFSPSIDHPSSLQQVLPIPSPCPLGNSDQNVSEVPSSPPNSTEVAPPLLITYQRRTRQVGSTVPEFSPHDPHPPPTNPQTMDPSSSSPITPLLQDLFLNQTPSPLPHLMIFSR